MRNYTGTRLAVPPMHDSIDPAIRAKVLDYVRRRLIVEAISLAEEAEADRLAELYQDRHIGADLMRRARRPVLCTHPRR